MARHKDRPYTLDYIRMLFDDFIELHGDRTNSEDPPSLVGLRVFRVSRSLLSVTRRGAI